MRLDQMDELIESISGNELPDYEGEYVVSPGYIIIPPGVYPKGVLIDSTYTYANEPNFEFPFFNESLTQKLIDMGRVREL